jgi:hypothetical protein
VYVHEEEEQRIGLNDDDGEYVLEVHHDKRHVSSAKSATFNLVNNIIGGGVLVPPPQTLLPNAACSLLPPPSLLQFPSALAAPGPAIRTAIVGHDRGQRVAHHGRPLMYI